MAELVQYAGLAPGELRGASLYAEQTTTLHTLSPSYERITAYARKPTALFFGDRDRLFIQTTRQSGGAVWFWPLRTRRDAVQSR